MAPKNIREFPQKMRENQIFFPQKPLQWFSNLAFLNGCWPIGKVVECTAGGAFRGPLGLRNLKQRK